VKRRIQIESCKEMSKLNVTTKRRIQMKRRNLVKRHKETANQNIASKRRIVMKTSSKSSLKVTTMKVKIVASKKIQRNKIQIEKEIGKLTVRNRKRTRDIEKQKEKFYLRNNEQQNK
jgi:hypothetical protein